MLWLLKKFRLWYGLSSVPEVCQESSETVDWHDYTIDKGGDGIPQHFHTYTCWNCGKKFSI